MSHVYWKEFVELETRTGPVNDTDKTFKFCGLHHFLKKRETIKRDKSWKKFGQLPNETLLKTALKLMQYGFYQPILLNINKCTKIMNPSLRPLFMADLSTATETLKSSTPIYIYHHCPHCKYNLQDYSNTIYNIFNHNLHINLDEEFLFLLSAINMYDNFDNNYYK
eukprot:83439_1